MELFQTRSSSFRLTRTGLMARISIISRRYEPNASKGLVLRWFVALLASDEGERTKRPAGRSEWTSDEGGWCVLRNERCQVRWIEKSFFSLVSNFSMSEVIEAVRSISEREPTADQTQIPELMRSGHGLLYKSQISNAEEPQSCRAESRHAMRVPSVHQRR